MATSKTDQIAEILHQAAETHHVVYAIADGADDDWATWYSDWLVRLSALPDLLGATPVRSDLTHLLVQLDRDFVAAGTGGRWEDAYAEAIVARFGQG
jgi:hypothetical protein